MPFWEIIIIIQRRSKWPGTGGAVGLGVHRSSWQGLVKVAFCVRCPPPVLSQTRPVMQEPVLCIQQHVFVS